MGMGMGNKQREGKLVSEPADTSEKSACQFISQILFDFQLGFTSPRYNSQI